jgi:hypothetical protein
VEFIKRAKDTSHPKRAQANQHKKSSVDFHLSVASTAVDSAAFSTSGLLEQEP